MPEIKCILKKIYIRHLGTPLYFKFVLMDCTAVSKEPPLRLRSMFHNNMVMLQKDKWLNGVSQQDLCKVGVPIGRSAKC